MYTYTKSNSFTNPVTDKMEIDRATKGVLDALEELNNGPTCVGNVLERARNDLLVPKEDPKSSFKLLPHAAAEINRLPEDRIADYLFHRYRYDVYPRTKELDNYPPCLHIEPASVCNFRCVFCYQTEPKLSNKANGHMGFMDLDLFKGIVDQAEGNVEILTLSSRGEPTLNPKFTEMMSYVAGKFLSLKINTNASRLNEEMAHAILQADVATLVFSADAATEPLYSSMRVNGKLEETLANVEAFQRIREKEYPGTRTITRVSGVKYGKEQNLQDMERAWGGLVDQVAFVHYNPWENCYDSAPVNLDTPCSDLWRRMFVWWDGKVNPCDVDYLSTLKAGEIGTSSLSEIWKGEFYQNLRRRHLGGERTKTEPCRRCSLV